MALRAVVGESGVTARNFSGIKKCFVSARLKKQDSSDAANNSEEADPVTRSPPPMLPAVVAEIAFVAFGNLFLRSARRSHGRRLVVEQRHERVPRGEHEQQKRNRHVHKQPAVQPMM